MLVQGFLLVVGGLWPRLSDVCDDDDGVIWMLDDDDDCICRLFLFSLFFPKVEVNADVCQNTTNSLNLMACVMDTVVVYA